MKETYANNEHANYVLDCILDCLLFEHLKDKSKSKKKSEETFEFARLTFSQ
jgi:hypothetical protein